MAYLGEEIPEANIGQCNHAARVFKHSLTVFLQVVRTIAMIETATIEVV